MSYIGNSDNIMKPRKDSSIISLPVTFDYNGGKRDSIKSKILWSVSSLIIGGIVSVGVILSDGGFFLFNLVAGLLLFFLVVVGIRFFILKEHKLRNEMIELEDSDYKIDYSNLWGIYEIDDTYPYYVHMRDGKTALYVQFEKDVIVGKEEDYEYHHYEAISDAYNLAGSMKIGMCHIDYMDIIGNDDRLNNCFLDLEEVQNPDMKDILHDVFSNLQDKMNESVSTFDVYVFTFRTSESTFWYSIQQVISCLLDANYVSFKILDRDDIRELTKSIFNLHDFSVMEANSTAFRKDYNYKGVVPIKLIKYDGSVVILNKTQSEKKAELKEKELEKTIRKEELKKRRRNKKQENNVSSDIEFDLFD